MFPNFARSAIFTTAASSLFVLALCGSGEAESVSKACGAKYQAAKAAGTLNGLSWNKFYSQCAAEAKSEAAPAAEAPAATPAAPPAAPAAAPAPAPVAPKPTKTVTAPPPAAAPEPAAPAASGTAVFPSAVSPQYSTLSPHLQRLKTCSDQYQANKATNSNGGLKWAVKGGGYYHECNNKLKG